MYVGAITSVLSSLMSYPFWDPGEEEIPMLRLMLVVRADYWGPGGQTGWYLPSVCSDRCLLVRLRHDIA